MTYINTHIYIFYIYICIHDVIIGIPVCSPEVRFVPQEVRDRFEKKLQQHFQGEADLDQGEVAVTTYL